MSDSLTVKENRTGKEYTLPVTGGNVRAMDLRWNKEWRDAAKSGCRRHRES